jgi:hypothetical protein
MAPRDFVSGLDTVTSLRPSIPLCLILLDIHHCQYDDNSAPMLPSSDLAAKRSPFEARIADDKDFDLEAMPRRPLYLR